MKAINKDIIRLNPQWWLKIGEFIKGWVYDDCKIGLMQNDNKNYRYKSRDYVKYKSNQMRKFGKSKGTADRLKQYKGIPIESTNTSFVDMILSGRTIKSLKPKTSTEDSVTMAFPPDKAGIVMGNKRRGYDITGLNSKNKRKIKWLILQEYKKNKETLPKKVVINIG